MASLRAGETWPAQLGESLNESYLVVLCWSASANSSDWVHAEIKFALMARKAILRWCLDSVRLPDQLIAIHAVVSTQAADRVAGVIKAQRRRRYIRIALTAMAVSVTMIPLAWFTRDRFTSETIAFHGAIVDEQNHPVPNVSIEAAGQHTSTRFTGEFDLDLPFAPKSHQALKVLISKPGYQSQSIDTQTDVPLTRILEKSK